MVLTGRNPTEDLIEAADYVSEIRKVNIHLTAAFVPAEELNIKNDTFVCMNSIF